MPSAPQRGESSNGGSNANLVIALCVIVGATGIIIFIACITRRLGHNITFSTVMEGPRVRRARRQRVVGNYMLETFPVVKYGARLQLEDKPRECSVCTENFSESEDVRVLPCGHIYHQHCVDPWLLDFAGTCPLW
jgi:hypothetical protein